MDNIYLDNAATTPLDERVLDAMMPYLKHHYGNASSVHQFGRDTKVLLEDARDVIADFTGASSSEIYFTSGGTEANNFALKGMAFYNLREKNQIISSMIEHPAVIDTLEYLKKRFGYDITYISNDKYGVINREELERAITDQTLIVCMMHSNNELGVINDIAGIAEITKEKITLLHTDTVQSLGKTKFNVKELDCSTAAFSAHKIYGPKGIGALYIKKGTSVDKYIHGGKQERDRRGGTENIAAIAGFKKAIEILNSEMDSDIKNYLKLKNKLINGIKNNFNEKVILNTSENINSLPNIVNISFKEATVNSDTETILINLDLKGIAVSSGSACTSGSVQPSRVLKALGYDDSMAKSSLRISFGRFNKEEDVDYLLKCLGKILN